MCRSCPTSLSAGRQMGRITVVVFEIHVDDIKHTLGQENRETDEENSWTRLWEQRACQQRIHLERGTQTQQIHSMNVHDTFTAPKWAEQVYCTANQLHAIHWSLKSWIAWKQMFGLWAGVKETSHKGSTNYFRKLLVETLSSKEFDYKSYLRNLILKSKLVEHL